jgi:hypothetical protein
MSIPSPIIACDTCGREFESLRRKNEHVKRIHSSEETRTCPHCDCVLANAASLPRHAKLCKKRPINEITCDLKPLVVQNNNKHPHKKVTSDH